MEKNFNIFDIILFEGNLDFLNLRVLEFQGIVDFHIIVTDSKDVKIDLELKENILVFNKTPKLYEELKQFFTLKYKSFDDLIFMSKENELPDFRNIDEIIKETKTRNLLLKHKTLCWNYDYYSRDSGCGSFVYSFSNFLTHSNIIEKYWKILSNTYESNFEKIPCGWKFLNFHEPKDDEIYARETLLPSVIYNPETTYKLEKVHNNFELPKNIGTLAYYKIGREYMKKHLFLVESDKDVNLNEIRKIYDTVSVIEFSDSVNEMIAENIGESVSKSILHLPSNVLYGEKPLKDFQEDYKKNDIKRIIETIFPQDEDTIRIIYKGFGDISFTWESLKNENFSEIINPS
jgi:hypothetical protein